MNGNENLPQFYRKPVMLNREIHAGLTITESPTRYAFTAKAQPRLMANIEFFNARRRLPTILEPTGDGIVPFGQPMRQVQFAIQRPDAFHTDTLDQWLQTALEISPAPCVCRIAKTEQTSQVIDLAARCLSAACALLQAIGLPVFDAGRILNIEPDRQNSSRWFITAALVHVDHVPPVCYEMAIQAAVKLVIKVVASASLPGNMDAFYSEIENNLLRFARTHVVSGKSTIPLLRCACRQDIPFIHAGGGVYQLGCGCKSRYIDRSITENDSLIGAKMAQHKGWSANLLRAAGLPAPDHDVVSEEREALSAAARLGWPVVVKPADGDRGEGIATGINDHASLRSAFQAAKKASKIQQVIIEREVPGVCHRLLVVEGRVLYAVKRLPKSVTGDGRQTVANLIRYAQKAELAKAPWLRQEPFPDDALALRSMHDMGFSMESVPAAGEKIPLRPRESTQWGGEDEDLTAKLHPDNRALAQQAAALFHLQVAGIDIISLDISKPWHENGAIINEVNFAPALEETTVNRQYLPRFFKHILNGDGRIPVTAFIGGEPAMIEAKALQQTRRTGKIRCFLTGSHLTLDDSGAEIPFALTGLYQRCRALLTNRRVEELIVVLQTDEWLHTGAPVDRLDKLTVSGGCLTSWKNPDRQLSQDKSDHLLKLLRSIEASHGHEKKSCLNTERTNR